ncbi:MFS transporter [Komagataeibacter intermedius]|uniref:Sugar transporter n=2 Tax=Komagataeibacter intermedius TaxID=66229 RepID=A0A0N1N630_9PROT|nr:MFS transporter [Komagataeibacter intermedius]KPH86058.1 sugar transporter [Komagataeibacter intermedius AF2]MCF3637298.1 MFS transporter [Komagataeibacter intermedius]GAN87936.1 major facilitator superfamily sugar transporter [Komagataeibacter intermedius TF2]GBQ75363.1 major facilitator superfamily sugar transporter [Komagataeibacter intermedius NRIC 0521]
MKAPRAAAPSVSRIGLAEVMAFGAGDMGFNIIWGLMLSYLAYFYTEISLLPVQMVGFMLMAARAASLVTDPVVGLWIDHRPAGRQAIPVLRGGIAPFMVLVALTFMPLPHAWPVGMRGLCAAMGYMALCVAYGVVNTAYGAMTSLISPDHDMRLRLATSRMVGATLGSLLVSITTLPMVDWLGHGDRQAGFALYMVVVACVVGGLLWLPSRFCHERVATDGGDMTARARVAGLLANRGWRRLTGAMLLTMLGSTFLFGALVYDVRYVLHDSDHVAGWLLGLVSLMVLAGCGLSLPLAGRWGTASVMRGGTLAAGGVLLVAYVLPARMEVLGISLALFGLCVGICNPVCFTLLAHCMDGGDGFSGTHTVGLAWALNSTASKMAFDVGGSLLAGVLAASGLVSGVGVQSVHAQAGIHAGFLLVPALLYLLAGGVVLRYFAPQNPVEAVNSTASPPPT